MYICMTCTIIRFCIWSLSDDICGVNKMKRLLQLQMTLLMTATCPSKEELCHGNSGICIIVEQTVHDLVARQSSE